MQVKSRTCTVVCSQGLHSRQHARCTFNDRSIDRTLQASLILTRSTCQACTSRRSSVVRRTRNVSSDARCRRQVSRNVHQRILSLVYAVSSVPSGIVWNARLHSSAIGLGWFGCQPSSSAKPKSDADMVRERIARRAALEFVDGAYAQSTP